MLTDIVPRDLPRRPAGALPPPTRLDQQILAAIDGEMRPTEIAQAVGQDLQVVVRRLRALRERGRLVRVKPEGAAANGPGSTLYRLPA